ncbi:MAG: DUF2069 domain-containing protein [Burkholderiales bacterium]|nr:DUF2069 domain-containing protein [Burkholderiales bacterium]
MNMTGAVLRWRWTATALLAALLLLCSAWELWLAPLRPGGSWLALKALPLLWILPGIAGGRNYTYRVSTLLILAYFMEGVVRGWSDSGLSARLGLAEIVLSVAFFFAAIAHLRAGRPVRPAIPETTA